MKSQSRGRAGLPQETQFISIVACLSMGKSLLISVQEAMSNQEYHPAQAKPQSLLHVASR